MPSPFAIRIERTLASEASCLAWCPSMDLLAFVAGERQLPVHRLSWQRLFVLSAFDHTVTAIAWRPDGERARAPSRRARREGRSPPRGSRSARLIYAPC
jgi:hypothetical protein